MALQSSLTEKAYCTVYRAGRFGVRISAGARDFFPKSPDRISFPGVKRPECSFNHAPPSSAEVKERVELYLYSLSGSPRPVLGRNVPFPFSVN